MKLLSKLTPAPGATPTTSKVRWFDHDGSEDNDDDADSSSGSSGDSDDSSSSSGQEDDNLIARGEGGSSSYEESSSDAGLENNNGDDDVKHVVKMIRKESADVDMWREIVTGVLVITAAMVTVTTYVLLSRQEVQEFSAGFSDLAGSVQVTLEYNQQTLMESFQGLSDVMTSLALGLNSTWPLVTIPDFDVHARHVQTLTRTPALWSAPIVTGQAMRAEWEQYVQQQVSTLNIDVPEQIYNLENNMTVMVPVMGEGPFAPAWQQSPSPIVAGGRGGGAVNWDVQSFDSYKALSQIASNLNKAVLSDVLTTLDPMTSWPLVWKDVLKSSSTTVSGVSRQRHRRDATVEDDHAEDEHHSDDEDHDTAPSFTGQCGGAAHSHASDTPPPSSTYLQPVYDTFDESSHVIVAYILASFDWACSFHGFLHEGEQDVDIVLSDCHDEQYTWTLQGEEAVFRGHGDLHDELYGKYQTSMDFAPYPNVTEAEQSGACIFAIDVYPTGELRESYRTNKPAIYAGCVGAVFFLMAFTILTYDQFVKRRNDKIIDTASRSHAILSSLFPSQIRDRLYDDAKKAAGTNNKTIDGWVAPKSGLKGFLADQGDHAIVSSGVDDEELFFDTKPLADLFPECTVLFADLAGFTAWSSVREPSQVFTLLETIYRAMDSIARKRRIFKVETVGDCYVAVCGLPDARKDHAVAMVRFAKDCVYKVDELTNKLEVSLGPDTADLTVRVGIHSGPVTAGVLRGEKSRFQLFGDTVNTAARMESTGVPGKIHVSEETANLIKAAGKGHWVTPRAEAVSAKGKGVLSTYFVSITSTNKRSSRSSEPSSGNDEGESTSQEQSNASSQNMKTLLSDKTTRLIEWNVAYLLRLLKEISAHRLALEELTSHNFVTFVPPCESKSSKRAFDEVQEIIALPEFNPEMIKKELNHADGELGESVVAQLRNYVTNIAVMYADNPFHNFEHASHVTMSVTKLLARIVAPSEDLDEFDVAESDHQKKTIASLLHDNTYGITSDPLTQFSCVLSALIHDVDHAGVPNSQLCIENKALADVYNGKSVAEQNSLDLSWDMLMDDQYAELRAAIYTTEVERQRFRGLVVNSVMATDIMDKELKTLRNARWDRAFTEGPLTEDAQTTVNRKATIVIEHLIQASDVAHTMQHWHVYRKWNERLFREMYAAYEAGRADKNPAEFWYQGEMGFFDFYIIPLAKKLKDCGVFGVSSDEYLNYAERNRAEWEAKGQEIVSGMLESLRNPCSQNDD